MESPSSQDSISQPNNPNDKLNEKVEPPVQITPPEPQVQPPVENKPQVQLPVENKPQVQTPVENKPQVQSPEQDSPSVQSSSDNLSPEGNH